MFFKKRVVARYPLIDVELCGGFHRQFLSANTLTFQLFRLPSMSAISMDELNSD